MTAAIRRSAQEGQNEWRRKEETRIKFLHSLPDVLYCKGQLGQLLLLLFFAILTSRLVISFHGAVQPAFMRKLPLDSYSAAIVEPQNSMGGVRLS